jgi:membrane-associated phospholipid phosphatase
MRPLQTCYDLSRPMKPDNADAVLTSRVSDGSEAIVPGSFDAAPGKWKPSAPTFEAVLPQWPEVDTFFADAALLVVDPPPAITSAEYASAVQQVADIGSKTSASRTEEQTAISQFWADGSGTASPPGHWNQIATDVLSTKRLPLIEQVRTMALLNIAMADAGIGSWKAKYDYDLWRPIDAIHSADLDVNAGTTVDPSWMPLLNTPQFPAYVSGHSSFSGAASAVLTGLLGANFSFRSRQDTETGWKPIDASAHAETTDRAFSSFAHAAEEAGLSRIYGGIHYSFDNIQGLALGERVGNRIVMEALKKL